MTDRTPLTDEELAALKDRIARHGPGEYLPDEIPLRLIAEVRRLRKMVDVDRGVGAWRLDAEEGHAIP